MVLFRFLKVLLDPLITLFLAPWLLARLRHPNDLQRAQVIEMIALGIAHQLVREFPTAPWAELVEMLVERLAESVPDGLKTKNTAVYERAASAALAKTGKAGG